MAVKDETVVSRESLFELKVRNVFMHILFFLSSESLEKVFLYKKFQKFVQKR